MLLTESTTAQPPLALQSLYLAEMAEGSEVLVSVPLELGEWLNPLSGAPPLAPADREPSQPYDLDGSQ